MLIRPATKEDAPAIASFISMAEGEMVQFFTGTDNREAAARELVKFVLDPRQSRYSLEQNLVAEIDGRPAGSVMSFPADRQHELDEVVIEALNKRGIGLRRLSFEGIPGTYYLSTMGVNPDFRGKGVGTALMEAAEERARKLGFSRASLLVSPDKPRAKNLYERRGYRVVEDIAIAEVPYHRMALEFI